MSYQNSVLSTVSQATRKFEKLSKGEAYTNLLGKIFEGARKLIAFTLGRRYASCHVLFFNKQISRKLFEINSYFFSKLNIF